MLNIRQCTFVVNTKELYVSAEHIGLSCRTGATSKYLLPFPHVRTRFNHPEYLTETTNNKIYSMQCVIVCYNTHYYISSEIPALIGQCPYNNMLYREHIYIHFANDSVFYAQAPTINSAQANLQNDINNVVEWFNNNRLHVNVSK